MQYTGRIVEFLSSGSLKMGLVTAQLPNKLQVIDVNGRNLSLATKAIVVVHSETAQPNTLGSEAEALQDQINRLQAEVDVELLWESVRDQPQPLSLQQLAEEYFGQEDGGRQSAIFRAILEDRLYFKIKGLEISARTPEQVEEQLHVQRVRAEREAFLRRREDWLKAVLEGSAPAEIPDEFASLVSDIEAFLLGARKGEIERLLEQLDPDQTAKAAAFQILVHCGRLPEDADPLLIIAGIEERFPPEVLEAVDQLEPFSGDPERTDFSGALPLSIDDPDTIEIDDAITVSATDTGWQVGIHIADASHYIPGDDLILREAMRRGATLYLPNRTVMMLPDRLACDLSSLTEDQLRPSLSLVVDFDSAGQILDWRFQRGQLRVCWRLNYDQVDEELADPKENAPWLEKVRVLDRLTQALMQERVEQGAIMILKPEVKVRVEESGQITVKILEKESPSRRMVGELMILANRLAAELAMAESIPIIYRAQEPPSGPIDLPGHYDPLMTDQAFRKLKRSAITLEPAPHASLALNAYAQITSPIRRLTDLASQQQISAHLENRPLPHDTEQLEALRKAIETTERDLRAVERQANRLFLLRYLEQECKDRPIEAVILGSTGSGYPVETCDFYARGRLISPHQHAPGEHVTVRVDRIDPEDNILTFRLFQEDDSPAGD